jgi:hypothetical protein
MVAALSALFAASCGGSLPRPPLTPIDAADYVAVPFAPRVPPVEFIPPAPSKDAVWVDGSWEWAGSQYGWRYGSWVVPPVGARYAPWTVVRREADGQLFFAPSSWKDASGKTLESAVERSFTRAFGAAGRARTRPGGENVGRETRDSRATSTSTTTARERELKVEDQDDE